MWYQYLQFFLNHLHGLLEYVPLAVRQRMWFWHDGFAPHNHQSVRYYLSELQGVQWIARERRVAWPSRSPDLNLLDFSFFYYLLGFLEDVPLRVRQRMWFWHDSFPLHIHQSVRYYFSELRGVQWIAREGRVASPSRFPNLNPLDFKKKWSVY